MAKVKGNTRQHSSKINENLDRIKGSIKDWNDYFKDNFRRFNKSRHFVFESSLSTEDISVLQELKKPQLEFNIQEAFLSRLRGEFSKQEPTLHITSKSSANKPADPQLIEFLERHLHSVLFDSNRDNLQYDVITDCLSGGFSAIKVLTKYNAPLSFDQDMVIERFFDPTLSVFDKSARLSHKGDGRFSAELFPKTIDEITSEYGSDISKKLKFHSSDSLEGFNWTYSTNSHEDIALIADYYEKKVRKQKIVQVSGGTDFPAQVMTEKQYEAFAEQWASERIEQVPVIIGKPRVTDIETIDRYVLCGDSILEHTATDWAYLPHIFVDGNSLMMRKEAQGSSYQLTRPFLYHAEGIQKLKNFAGICLANELENMVQHKFMMSKESIPEMYTDPLTDIQKASVLIYNGYAEDNPDRPLQPPMVAPRSPIPPEITSTFTLSDQMTQTILGSYDASLGINDNQLSGKAITNGAMQSNPVAVPYMVSYMKAMNQVGTIILDLIPKYMRTPRSVPIVNKKGKREYALINQEGGISMEYDSNALDINIEAGVSFEVQRSQAFQMLVQLMGISPVFQEFMTKGEGLETLLDNVEIRGIDKLKSQVEGFIQQQKQKEQQMQQMQQQQAQHAQQQAQQAQQMQAADMKMKQENNPAIFKKAELQQKAQKDSAEIKLKKDKVEIDYMLALSEIENQEIENQLRASEIEARNARTAVDLQTKHESHQHGRAMDLLNLHNKGDVDVEIDTK